MTHRVHPKIFRIKYMEDWDARGFYGKQTPRYLEEDVKIREFLKKELKLAGIARIEIERFSAKISIFISSSRPGLIIGRGGEGIERLRREIQKLLLEKKAVNIEIQNIRNPWVSAELTSQWIAQQIEKRVPFRRVLKQALSKVMANREVEGARVQVSGRLNGAEMARREWLKEGKLPRQSLRSNLDYGEARALCTYGIIGVKVWIYKGEKTAE